MKQQVIRISVRDLVEFLERSGDLDSRSGRAGDAKIMQAGSRLHRKIQGRMGSGYHAEVPLKYRKEWDRFTVQVEGRADGIWEEDQLITIDEIKGTYREVDRMTEPVRVHLAQARCYAFIYGEQNGLERIGVRMVYANLETEEVRYFTENWEWQPLRSWFEDLMERYRRWLEFQADWKEKRDSSLKKLVFPYPYREGQRELAAGVYRSILRKKRLFIQAPTGVGKTLSALFPSLKAVGEGLGDKIFYLTARTITRTVASDTLDLFREQDMKVKSLVLTAKEKLCVCQEVQCDPDHCPRAKGHFDRINDAVYDLWTKGPDSCTREVILAQAEKYQVCPFELSLDLSLWMDVIICDYNYVFDLNVYLKRFFGEGVKGEYLFLVDEAHNLVERGREMYSASLKRECENGYQRLEQAGGFVLPMQQLSGELDRYLEQPMEEEQKKKLLEFYFQVQNFLNVYDLTDENYEIYTELTADGRFFLHLYCVRPAENLKLRLERGNSTVFFSATLLPVNYYKDLLTGDPEDYAVYAQSPFDPGKRALLIGTDVSSRYTRRGEQEYAKMAESIARTVTARKGNYLIFFPSYQLMWDVQERCEQMKGFTCVCQNPDMKEKEREEFLQLFREERETSLAAFCVMGGIFSEGIDLTGEQLIGAVIVGTGLPQVCLERQILKEYFDRKGMDGFAYAYLYPGMNKVLQAAGRVIRTTEDRGVIVLLDDRFRSPAYQNLFPREWYPHTLCRVSELSEHLRIFWKEHS